MAERNPIRFIEQTRSEVSKITWAGRREVLLTSAMVFVLSMVAMLFFFLVDLGIRTGFEGLLSLLLG